ncbi:MAG: ATP-binding cassette domain-containing protein [Flavobacteriaceae bacterium]|jgi:cell division transport system ATP-binding protein|nr:ATP-binding cassette domain-containing protein [Flavobacteriaceae bacterium]MBT4112905.1 ATP-binding cassette domain-containing protein [Flavobacteriaceae bacterium]MBT4246266.1 ATP-binding cassette domain-containing protein [Flavobacteriaceae bacterium]MBT4613600.1 ATP-binding cassette domain-containing protein [Flavobacteriaceae bacterium]MBT5246292.1 ATP-binding cassette domain-containing protein [Flavobacteriaceae bacterium]
MGKPILVLNNVSIIQDNKQVLSEVNIEINNGEFVYLIGRTGSGKTSLIKSLYADLKLNDGTGSIVDIELNNLEDNEIPFLRRKLGIIFQDFKLFSDRSVAENLKFVLKATGWSDESKINSRIIEVLEKVHIENLINKFTSQLSGGEQQKVAIARALLNNPKLIIADEPTGNLDPKTSIEVMEILMELNKKGNTILMATHDFILIDKFPNRTYICVSGKIAEIDLKNKNINTIYK